MNMRTTFILMLIFIGLGSISIFDPFHWKAKEAEKKEHDTYVFWLKDSKVTSFTITTKDGSFEFSCDSAAAGCSLDSQSNWHLQKPLEAEADPSAVGALLAGLRNLEIVEKLNLEDPGRFGEYGLDKPQVEINFQLHGDKKAHFLKVGNTSAIGPSLYAASGDRDALILLIPAAFLRVASGDLFHWRNKRLFPEINGDDLISMAWDKYEFQREKGEWRMKKPLNVKANMIMVGGLASTLTYLSAKSVYSENPDSPEVKALLHTKAFLHLQLGAEKNSLSLDLYKKPGEKPESKVLVAKISGKQALYVIDGTPFDRFQKNILEYRERRLLNAQERSSVEKLEFEFPRDKKEVSFTRSGLTWKADTKDVFSSTRINGFLDGLSLAEAEAFVPKKKKLSDVIATVTMGKEQKKFHFVIDGKTNVLADGDLPEEQRKYGMDFVKVLPVRYVDLLDENNKKVIVSEPNGKSPEPATH